MGQIVIEVERCAAGQALIVPVNYPGGDILEPDRILNGIRKAAGRVVDDPQTEPHLER